MTETIDPPPLSSQPPAPPSGPTSLSAGELARWAWRQLTSMRTALILLMLLALAAIPGSLVPQERVDPNAVANWQSAHRSLTPVYAKLGLFHVYGSAWFSAIYLLLMLSLIGCIVPRLRVHWRAATAAPPPPPRNLLRMPASVSATSAAEPGTVAAAASRLLRRSHYRVVVVDDRATDTSSVSAQRGYLREAGNLLFHISIVVVLLAFGTGDLFGYRGDVNLVTGQTFTNTQEAYDDFNPGRFFDAAGLSAFNVKLDDFQVRYLTSGPELGQPTSFRGDLTYQPSPGAPSSPTTLEVNHPLSIGDTSVFLVGNGYAPVVTVRDGQGQVVYAGPTPFLPTSTSYASWGVIKAPDAQPTQLGFDGQFLPTLGHARGIGAYSQYPDTLAPALSLTAYRGDLGLGSGVPQSVYALNKAGLTVVRNQGGSPLRLTLAMGETRRLPDGLGSIRFDGVRRYARLQLSSVPGSSVALGGVVLALVGLVGSLYIRPRRIWVRARATAAGTVIEVAGLDQRDRKGLHSVLAQLLDNITKATT